jgi:hypothetical protein
MKKFLSILTVAGLVATTINVSAQKSEHKIKLGAKAGLNISNLKFSGTDAPSTKTLTGLVLGGYAGIPISGGLSFQPELLYGQYGGKLESSSTSGTTTTSVTVDFKLNYISLPVLAKYSFSESGFSLVAGPQIGMLLSAKVLGVDFKKYFKSTDLSGVFGAEYELKNGLSFAARYQLGLGNIGTTELTGSGDGKVKNSAVQVTVGYAFLK